MSGGEGLGNKDNKIERDHRKKNFSSRQPAERARIEEDYPGYVLKDGGERANTFVIRPATKLASGSGVTPGEIIKSAMWSGGAPSTCVLTTREGEDGDPGKTDAGAVITGSGEQTEILPILKWKTCDGRLVTKLEEGLYNLNDGSPVPLGQSGSIVQFTIETEYNRAFAPITEFICDHVAGDSIFSSAVYDIHQSGLDRRANAGLHTHWWVKQRENSMWMVTWNLKKSEQDETGYGLVTNIGDGAATSDKSLKITIRQPTIDQAGLSANLNIPGAAAKKGDLTTLAYDSYLKYGYSHPGHASADKHQYGMNEQGEYINANHNWMKGYFYYNQQFDAPLDYEPVYNTRPPILPNRARVHFQTDPSRMHDFELGPRPDFHFWWAETIFGAPTPPPYIPIGSKIPNDGSPPMFPLFSPPRPDHNPASSDPENPTAPTPGPTPAAGGHPGNTGWQNPWIPIDIEEVWSEPGSVDLSPELLWWLERERVRFTELNVPQRIKESNSPHQIGCPSIVARGETKTKDGQEYGKEWGDENKPDKDVEVDEGLPVPWTDEEQKEKAKEWLREEWEKDFEDWYKKGRIGPAPRHPDDIEEIPWDEKDPDWKGPPEEYKKRPNPQIVPPLAPIVGHFNFIGKIDTTHKTWSYTQEPENSVFEGGTASGGIWITPAEFSYNIEEPTTISDTFFGFHHSLDFGWGDVNNDNISKDGMIFSTTGATGSRNLDLKFYDTTPALRDGVFKVYGTIVPTVAIFKGDNIPQNYGNTAILPDAYSMWNTSLTPDALEIATTGSNSPIVISPHGTGGVLFNDGALATPSIAFASDTSHGIYVRAANETTHTENVALLDDKEMRFGSTAGGDAQIDWESASARLRVSSPLVYYDETTTVNTVNHAWQIVKRHNPTVNIVGESSALAIQHIVNPTAHMDNTTFEAFTASLTKSGAFRALQLWGFNAQISINGSGTVSLAYANKSRVDNNGGGTLTTAYGNEAFIFNRNAGSNIATGIGYNSLIRNNTAATAITTAYNFRADAAQVAGAITTLSSYYAPDLSGQAGTWYPVNITDSASVSYMGGNYQFIDDRINQFGSAAGGDYTMGWDNGNSQLEIIGITATSDFYISPTGNMVNTSNLDNEGYAVIGDGQALDANRTLQVCRDFTQTAGSFAAQLQVGCTISGVTADNAYAGYVSPTGMIQASGGITTPLIASFYIGEPAITVHDEPGSTVTKSAALVIGDSASEAVTNYGLLLENGARVFNDIALGLSSGKIGGANQPTWAAFEGNIKHYTFGVNDYIEPDAAEIEHGYDEGTDVELHCHIFSNGQEVGDHDVNYEIEYTIANASGVTTAAAILTSGDFTIPAGTTTKTHYKVSIGTISIAALQIEANFSCRFRRIALVGGGTAPAADPWVTMVGLHIIQDSIGSRSIGSKN